MPQPLRLAVLLAVLALPLVEIAILIKVGGRLGFWPVLLIVILTAFLGIAVVRQRGISIFSRVFAEIEAGNSGLEPMFDSLLAVTAGILLILPGLTTDILGLLLLLPPVRALVARWARPHIHSGSTTDATIFEGRFKTRTTTGPTSDEPAGRTVIIEGDYERIEEQTANTRKPKPNT